MHVQEGGIACQVSEVNVTNNPVLTKITTPEKKVELLGWLS